jgi:hypothetical protein
MGRDRNVTIRRNVQQAKHCVEEALSVIETNEDPRCAADDLKQAAILIEEILKRIGM